MFSDMLWSDPDYLPNDCDWEVCLSCLIFIVKILTVRFLREESDGCLAKILSTNLKNVMAFH
jgi:hypothetical protein